MEKDKKESYMIRITDKHLHQIGTFLGDYGYIESRLKQGGTTIISFSYSFSRKRYLLRVTGEYAGDLKFDVLDKSYMIRIPAMYLYDLGVSGSDYDYVEKKLNEGGVTVIACSYSSFMETYFLEVSGKYTGSLKFATLDTPPEQFWSNH